MDRAFSNVWPSSPCREMANFTVYRRSKRRTVWNSIFLLLTIWECLKFETTVNSMLLSKNETTLSEWLRVLAGGVCKRENLMHQVYVKFGSHTVLLIFAPGFCRHYFITLNSLPWFNQKDSFLHFGPSSTDNFQPASNF